MTTVRVRVQVPAAGAPVAAAGFLRWEPTARRVVPASGGQPATIVLPDEFESRLVGGAVDVDVEPSTLAWVWKVTEAFHGLPANRRYFAVPDQATVDYADLLEIDPTSLAPTPSAAPAWLAPFEALSAGTVTPTRITPAFT